MYPQDDVDIEDLAKKSGQKKSYPITTLDVPIITINGNEGIFSQKYKGEKFDIQSKTIEIVILRVRKYLSEFESGITTTEHDGNKSVAVAFEYNGEKKKWSLLENNLSEVLKEKYKLGTHQVLYVIHENELKKLDVKGGSLSQLYDYFKEFSKDYMFQYKTTVFTIEKEGRGKKYFAGDFQKGEPLNKDELKLVAKHIVEISDTLQDNRSMEKVIEVNKAVAVKEELPESDDGATPQGEEGIDPSKIPF